MSTPPPGITAGSRFVWCVRREVWEHRAIYLGPLTVAAIVLFGYAIALAALPGRIRAAAAIGAPEVQRVIEEPYLLAALMLMLVEMVVAALYSIDALYGERRDRSVLFWKSLPVSNALTVVAKASIPILVLPLLTFAVTMATQCIMLAASSVVLAASGLGADTPWTAVPLVRLSRINLGHLVTFHGIWYAPVFAWLLLVSACATRAPLLWAVLPPVAIGIVERVAFDSSSFTLLMKERLMGGPAGGSASSRGMDMLASHTFADFLRSPGLWIGLVVATAFLAGAARLRRARTAI